MGWGLGRISVSEQEGRPNRAADLTAWFFAVSSGIEEVGVPQPVEQGVTLNPAS